MSEEKISSKKTASICSIKGMRSAVFKRAHDKAKEFELAGNTLMPEDWKEMMSESWVEVTEEIAKTCNQPRASEEKESTEIQSVEQAEQEPPDEKKEEKLEQVEQDNELVDVSSEPISAEEREKTE